MNLKELVRERIASTDAEIVEQLNTTIDVVPDHTLIGPVGLRKRLPMKIVEAAAIAFEAAAQQSASMRLLLGTFQSYGFDFADVDTIAAIDGLVEAGLPNVVGDALKSLGLKNVSIAENHIGSPVTLEQIQAARVEIIADDNRELVSTLAMRYNAASSFLRIGDKESAKALWEQSLALFE